MTRQRVAFIAYHACPLAAPGQAKSGGMNVYVRELARALGERGWPVDVFTRTHAGTENTTEQVTPMVRVIHLPGGPVDAPMESLSRHLPEFQTALAAFHREHGIDYGLVHSHYWLSGCAGQVFADGQNIPHMVTFHTLGLIKMQSRAGEVEPEERQLAERSLMSSAQRIIAFSSHERDAMVSLYGADPRRITLAPCGVDLSLFRPLEQERARGILGLNGEKVFLYVGRLEALKGVELLLRLPAHMDNGEKIRMLVVGGGLGEQEEVDRLRSLAKALNVDEVFDFVGMVDQGDLPVYYNAADVCVVPSYYESFGLTALESMACGTPVVASRVGGLPNVIQHGRTGYLQSRRCPETFANSLEMIISSPSLRQRMGQAARRRAEGMGWEQVADKISRVYDKLLLKRSKSR